MKINYGFVVVIDSRNYLCKIFTMEKKFQKYGDWEWEESAYIPTKRQKKTVLESHYFQFDIMHEGHLNGRPSVIYRPFLRFELNHRESIAVHSEKISLDELYSAIQPTESV